VSSRKSPIPLTHPFVVSDDPDHVADILLLIGFAFVSTLHALTAANLLKKDSAIRNLGLVFSIWIDFAHQFSCQGFDRNAARLQWPFSLVEFVDSNSDVVIEEGNANLKKHLASIRDYNGSLVTEDKGIPFIFEHTELCYDRPKWTAAFEAYKKKYGKVGGKELDITTMSNQRMERWAHGPFDEEIAGEMGWGEDAGDEDLETEADTHRYMMNVAQQRRRNMIESFEAEHGPLGGGDDAV